jgi:hypothetical protein
MDVTAILADWTKQAQAIFFFLVICIFGMCVWHRKIVGSIIMIFVIGIPGVFVLFPEQMKPVSLWLMQNFFTKF